MGLRGGSEGVIPNMLDPVLVILKKKKINK